MPSPFPGIDPYLEHPAIYPGFQFSLIVYLCEFIQTRLPDPYFADISHRLWVEPPSDEHREPRLEIYARVEGERIVTAIEVLSLSNKTPGKKGRDLYLQKQQEILDNPVHLVEIDLLRAGNHTTAVPLDRANKKAGRFDYHVCVHRFDKFEDYLVYPILLQQSLPEIRIPLLPGDADVPVDLQSVFDRCYDTGPYRRRVRYDGLPEPPLTDEQSKWVSKLLSEQADQ